MSLFLNKVAGLQLLPETLLKKNILYKGVFLSPFLQNTSRWLLLQNILLSITSTAATKCYHWPWVYPFTWYISRVKTSLFWNSYATSYDWTNLLLIKQVRHWKCYRKSEAVAQQFSVFSCTHHQACNFTANFAKLLKALLFQNSSSECSWFIFNLLTARNVDLRFLSIVWFLILTSHFLFLWSS